MGERILNAARHAIGRRLFYLGYRIQPVRIRRAISFMLTIGYEWGNKNEKDLDRIMNGEPVEPHLVTFSISSNTPTSRPLE